MCGYREYLDAVVSRELSVNNKSHEEDVSGTEEAVAVILEVFVNLMRATVVAAQSRSSSGVHPIFRVANVGSSHDCKIEQDECCCYDLLERNNHHATNVYSHALTCKPFLGPRSAACFSAGLPVYFRIHRDYHQTLHSSISTHFRAASAGSSDRVRARWGG